MDVGDVNQVRLRDWDLGPGPGDACEGREEGSASGLEARLGLGSDQR